MNWIFDVLIFLPMNTINYYFVLDYVTYPALK